MTGWDRRRRKDRGKKEKKEKKEKRAMLELTGRVQMTREGYAFIIVEGEEDDVFVKASKTRGALNGDTVRVAVTREKTDRQRREGEVLEVLERSAKPFVGILHIVGNQAWVLMQSRVMPYDIAIPIASGQSDDAAEGRKKSRREGPQVAVRGSLRRLGDGLFAVTGVHETVDGQRRELQARSGMKVAAVVDRWDRKDPDPVGHLVDVLGEPGENDTEMHAILAEFSLPYRFEPEVENAADDISDEITDRDRKERRDFSDVLTFTIDPADAKDFDDALSFRKLDNGNYEVGVHIADVTHYVTPGSVVDKEAQERGTSVYLVDRTVPMLPEKLSNKLCSLRPNEPKLCFSAVFEITPLAKIVSQWFGRTVINSDYRFAYETAQQIIDAGDKAMTMELRGGTDGRHGVVGDPVLEASPEAAEARRKAASHAESAMGEGVTTGCLIPDNLKEAVLILNKLASKLRKKRFASGAISFERPEMKVEVDEKGRPVRVYQKISREANWLIEEFMLLANRSVAEFVAKGCRYPAVPGTGLGYLCISQEEAAKAAARSKAKTFVYRIHDEPNRDKLEGLRSFIHNFGYELGSTENGKEISRELNSLFAKAKDTPEYAAIEMLSLRTMAKARYSTDNIGHYGLAFKYYTHFTSPIRRYPDMMVHRLLAMYLGGADSQKKDYYEGQCKHASEREVVAADAERASIKYKLVEFMQDKVGYEFEGHISGLTEWGMYVEIEPTKIEGMVALRDIGSDYFEFDEERYRVVGRRSRVVYNLGDAVRIRVKNANLDQKLIDYELVETGHEERLSPDEVYSGGQDSENRRNTAGDGGKARKEKIRKAIRESVRRKARKGGKGKRKDGDASSAGPSAAGPFSSGPSAAPEAAPATSSGSGRKGSARSGRRSGHKK